jgi:mercuric ion transport protein
MKDNTFTLGSVVAAFLASLCCLGPLLLGGLGLGTVLVATFAPLRPYFLAVSALLLSAGFYFVYRKPKPVQACEGEPCVPHAPGKRAAKAMLWLAAVAVVALALFPKYGGKLAGTSAAPGAASVSSLETSQLKITGMDCEVCASMIQRKLLETTGVVKAIVEYPAGLSTVQFDPSQITPERLVEVVNGTGYKASLLRSGGS